MSEPPTASQPCYQSVMTDERLTQTSKFIALVLRHKPEAAGLTLDENGWTSVSALLAGLEANGLALRRGDLDALVAADKKSRYEFSEDGQRIRARQGHSIQVDVGFERANPPARLYHGTVARSLEAIMQHGLLKMARHHVHLSPDVETAKQVGSRRGKPVVLVVDAVAMARDGHQF